MDLAVKLSSSASRDLNSGMILFNTIHPFPDEDTRPGSWAVCYYLLCGISQRSGSVILRAKNLSQTYFAFYQIRGNFIDSRSCILTSQSEFQGKCKLSHLFLLSILSQTSFLSLQLQSCVPFWFILHVNE